MINIRFINHSGFLIAGNGVNLLMDPWTEGSAFNDGWDLLSSSGKINYKELTHVWISHEHPDHFSVSDIRKIIQANPYVTFLFQKTKDGRVVNFIKKLGGKTSEQSDNELFFFNSNDFIRIIRCGTMDSMAIVHLGGKTIVNMNDCIVRNEITKLRAAMINLTVDCLATQFGYASFISNRDDPGARRKAVEDKLFQVEEQIEFFKPKFVIPFASFIFFSHEENFYMNDRQTDISEVVETIQDKKCIPVVLYPDDVFSFEERDNTQSIQKYTWDKSQIEPRRKSEKTQFQTLKKKADDYLKRVKRYHGHGAFVLLRVLSFIYKSFGRNTFDEVSLLVTDLSLKVKFNIITGLSIDEKTLHPDIYLGSQSLEYIFDYDWGWASLMVNGRMEIRNNASKLLFTRVFQMGNLKSRGISITKQPWQALGRFSQPRISDIEPLDIFLEAKRRSKVSHHSSL